MIARICRWLFDCRPFAALCFVLGGSLAAASVDEFAPDATLYSLLATCLYLPAMTWTGVIVEGIETRSDVRQRGKSRLIWTLIGCSILFDLVPLQPLENTWDAFRFTTAQGIFGWWIPLLLSACICFLATRVLVGAEKARQSVSTGAIGTFLQFVFIIFFVYFLQRRAQRLVRVNP